jgi:tetratricopeptide (TPR) repeat protein
MTIMTVIQRNLLIGLGVAALMAIGIYAYVIRSGTPSPDANPTSLNATTTVRGVGGTGSYTVEPVGMTPPSLDRPIIITASSSLSADNQKLLRTIEEQIIAQLRKEPTRVDLWLKLGTDRKIGGDYQAAIEAWEYVAQTAPKDISATAHGNLGDLYMYFLKDYAKADTRYNQAITLNPNVIEYYRALFYLYRDIFKDHGKAQAILTLGLKNNPNNPDLLGLQKQL